MDKYTEPDISTHPPQRLPQVWGLLATTLTKPAYIPKTFSEQMVIWDDTAGSGHIILCIYNTKSNAWMGVTISSI
jgi:hypothetical protein